LAAREKIREHRSDLPTPQEVESRQKDGWRLTAVEWDRGLGDRSSEDASIQQEIPYGLRISRDGLHLAEDAEEIAVLRQILSGLVDDRALSEIAEDLHNRGSRTRRGQPWKQVDLFELLPRIVEAGADILRSEAWSQERDENKLRVV
jgi:hypothetical protein